MEIKMSETYEFVFIQKMIKNVFYKKRVSKMKDTMNPILIKTLFLGKHFFKIFYI